MFGQRQVTEDGLELTFATNHMSYFVLTNGLRDSACGGRRRAGDQHFVARPLSRQDRFRRFAVRSAAIKAFPAYCRSKLCNILFTRALARRLAGTGVTANSLHPGFVSTRFGDQSGGSMARIIGLMKIFAISPEKGAETIIYLASSDEVAKTTGLYFYKCKAVEPSKLAQDDAAAERLWAETAKLAGIKE